MTPLAYYHHAGFASYVADTFMRATVFRTVSVLTRGIGLPAMLVLCAVAIGVAWLFSRRFR